MDRAHGGGRRRRGRDRGQQLTFLASTFFDRSQNPGIDMRLGVWAEAWQMFLAHPIVGIGVGTFDEVTYQMPGTKANLDFHLNGWHAHNVPLHILTEAGLLGLAAWIFLWYTVLRTFAKAWRAGDGESRLFSSAALASVIAFLVLSMTEVLIGARVHASLRMNLTIALLVVAGLRMALPDRSADMNPARTEPHG
jgi:O-antigen ligase